MRRNKHDAVVLTARETRLLAQGMVAWRLSDPDEWACWELVPSLCADGHAELIEAIRDTTDEAMRNDRQALKVWKFVQ